MKKAISIILALVFCLSMLGCFTTGASAVTYPTADTSVTLADKTAMIRITNDTGDVYLGKKPNSTNTGYEAAPTTATFGSGSASFDAATATLTLTNTTGITKIASFWGGYIIKVVGTNTLNVADGENLIRRNANTTLPESTAVGSIIVLGDGTLNVTGKKQLLYNDAADIVFGDKVTVNITCEESGIHIINDGKLRITGSAKVNVTSTKGPAINSSTEACNRIEVNSLAEFNVKETTAGNWQYAVFADAVRLFGGKFTINVDSSSGTGVPAALQIVTPAEGNDTYFLGGLFDVKVKGNSARNYGIYFKTARNVTFGGDVVANFTFDSLNATSRWGSTALDINAPSTAFTAVFTLTDKATLNFDGGATSAITACVIKNTDAADKKGEINLVGGTINAKNVANIADGYKGTTLNVKNVDIEATVSGAVFAVTPDTFVYDSADFQNFVQGETKETASSSTTADYASKYFKTAFKPAPVVTTAEPVPDTNPSTGDGLNFSFYAVLAVLVICATGVTVLAGTKAKSHT